MALTPQDIDLGQGSPPEALAALEATGKKQALPGLQGKKVVWRVWGEGPPLVLLHGGYGTWAHWVRMIAPLSRGRRLLVPDMPGFGESDDAPQPVSAETLAESVRLSLEPLLDAGERPAVCGFSFGGVIAGHLARLLGPRCRLLLLIAPGGLGAPRGPMPDLVRRRPDMTPEEIEAAHRRNLEILMVSDPGCIDPLALHIQAQNTAQHRVKSRPISGTDTLARALAEVEAPVKLLVGALDATIGPYLPEREAILKTAQPGAELRVEPGVGHWIMYERPERTAQVMEQLLA